MRWIVVCDLDGSLMPASSGLRVSKEVEDRLIRLQEKGHIVILNSARIFQGVYPLAKQIVYTFHMPAFLVLSGYLVNVGKDTRGFLRAMFWVFVPYAVMETGYVVMSSVLPVRERVSGLGLPLLLDKLFLAPMGPYWYLHTWLLCSLSCYGVWTCGGGAGRPSRLVYAGMVLAVLSLGCGLMSFANAFYFFAGFLLRRCGVSFLSFFRASWLSAPLFVLLCMVPGFRERATLGGAAITWSAVSFLLFVYPYVPSVLRRLCVFIGRNTLSVLLFSPVFTILTRFARPWFMFEPSGMCFLAASLCFVVAGCLGVSWLMDRMGVSRWFFGKSRSFSRWELTD